MLCIAFILLSCKKNEDAGKLPVFGVDKVDDVSLTDQRSLVLAEWAGKDLKSKYLVYVSAYNALKYVPPERIEESRDAIRKQAWQAMEEERRYESEDSYLYTAAKLGVFEELFWVMPYRIFEEFGVVQKVRNILQTSGYRFEERDLQGLRNRAGCVRGHLWGIPVHFCSLRTLPLMQETVMLDIDAGFFPAYAEEHGISKLTALKRFFDEMHLRQVRLRSINISYNTGSGGTKPVHRYIGDELLEGIRDPRIFRAESPLELWKYRDRAENMLSGGEDERVVEYLAEPLKKYPGDLPLRLLNAAAVLKAGGYVKSFSEMEDLCTEDVHYCPGFVYSGNILVKKKQPVHAEKFFLRAVETMPENAYAAGQYISFLERNGEEKKAGEMRVRFGINGKKRIH